ncbi:MAG: GDP-mannose-dependent alpha-(1-6)-phosphatidylinositol monomannoside mannosyltransferase [bacterium ADurb.Bin478]|nr:MAG: GDP-mannose-dependent alpha-(1-6)-phosphatidylinositol monomannoside mannosyltransferase [bacterium ADurb.Bin478]
MIIVGSGPEEKRLKALAGRNIEFTGWIDAQQLHNAYARCRALIFPGEEDFGMVPVEAQCWGKPVIAFGRGGSLETIAGHWADSGRKPAATCTGYYFRNQTVKDLIQAVEAFSRWQPNPKAIRKHALRFDTAVFIKAMNKLIQERKRL